MLKIIKKILRFLYWLYSDLGMKFKKLITEPIELTIKNLIFSLANEAAKSWLYAYLSLQFYG